MGYYAGGTLAVTGEEGVRVSLTPTSSASQPNPNPPICSWLTFSFLTASFTTSVPFGASTSVFPRNYEERGKNEQSMIQYGSNKTLPYKTLPPRVSCKLQRNIEGSNDHKGLNRHNQYPINKGFLGGGGREQ